MCEAHTTSHWHISTCHTNTCDATRYSTFNCLVTCKNSIQSCPFILCEIYHSDTDVARPIAGPKGNQTAVEASL